MDGIVVDNMRNSWHTQEIPGNYQDATDSHGNHVSILYRLPRIL